MLKLYYIIDIGLKVLAQCLRHGWHGTVIGKLNPIQFFLVQLLDKLLPLIRSGFVLSAKLIYDSYARSQSIKLAISTISEPLQVHN